MKKLLLLSIVLIVGCQGVLVEPDTQQMMFIYANYANSYYDGYINETVYEENTDVGGFIVSDPIVEFTHLKVNETVFSGDDYSSIQYGYTSFGRYDSTSRITSNFTPLDVEVKTSQGKMNGTISLPDTIMTLGLSDTSNFLQHLLGAKNHLLVEH